MSRFCVFCCFLFALWWPIKIDALDVSNCKQLFLGDDFLLNTHGSFAIDQNQPTKKGELLRNDQPWENEGFLGGYMSEFNKVDGSKYTWWTTARFNRGTGESVWRGTEVLTSEDGINWKRPAINKFSFSGNINNNLTSYGTEGTGKVPNGSTMEPRFGSGLMTLAGPWEARQVYTSEDGINFWSVAQPKEFKYYTDGTTQIMWNPANQKYIMYFRSWAPSLNKFGTSKRDFGRATVRWEWSPVELINDEWPTDLPSWVKFKGYYPALNADEMETPFYPLNNQKDIYYSGIFPYQEADCDGNNKLYIASNDVFDIVRDSAEIYLGYSRDNKNWTWASKDQPYIAPSTDGSYDSLHTNSILNWIKVGDKLRHYYTGGEDGHDHAWARSRLFWAEQRLDGFVSLDAGEGQSELLTKDLNFTGNILVLNSQPIGVNGEILVQLEDSSGNIFDGYSFGESIPITKDSVSNLVSWKNGSGVGNLNGKVIRIRIRAKNSKLFAFQFTEMSKIETKNAPTGVPTAMPTNLSVQKCWSCAGGLPAKREGNAFFVKTNSCDSKVDNLDYAAWAGEYFRMDGSPGLARSRIDNSWQADFDCDGLVNLNDYSIWASNVAGQK